MDATRRAVEAAARDSYGRLVAFLACRGGDIAAAEDALSEAFVHALQTWPTTGVPREPQAWLLTAARRRLIDASRSGDSRSVRGFDFNLIASDASVYQHDDEFPDERLRLLFACAHPAIAADIHAPLMLQAVLGLEAAEIARAFLVAPSAMSQRLVRAKAKIRDAGIQLEVPATDKLGDRLHAVLEAIYTAFGCGWDAIGDADGRARGLAEEAVWLGRMLAKLLPDEPEVLGLLALMLHSHARRFARRALDGRYVPLGEQDVNMWADDEIAEAERHLTAAARHGRIGRFQLEAAVQSAHSARKRFGRADWPTLALLYEGLVALEPSIGARVGQAAVVAEAYGAERGLWLLDEIEPERVTAYQPYWAVRGHLLAELNRFAEAERANAIAIGLTDDAGVKQFLAERTRLPSRR